MAQDLLGSSLRRVGVAALGLATAATLVAGCSSSSSKPPFSVNTSASSAGGSSTTPASGGGATSTSSSIGNIPSGFLSDFCKNYITESSKLSQAFANVGQSGGDKTALKAEVDLFTQFADKAPSEIKPSFEAIASALHDLESGNYAALQTDAPKLSDAEQKISAYFASGCH
jgi:hypothetical protein